MWGCFWIHFLEVTCIPPWKSRIIDSTVFLFLHISVKSGSFEFWSRQWLKDDHLPHFLQRFVIEKVHVNNDEPQLVQKINEDHALRMIHAQTLGYRSAQWSQCVNECCLAPTYMCAGFHLTPFLCSKSSSYSRLFTVFFIEGCFDCGICCMMCSLLNKGAYNIYIYIIYGVFIWNISSYTQFTDLP